MLYTPSHAELAQHPKTRKLARLLGVSIPTALGHLHLLWHFALKYAPDGDLARFDNDEVADGCMWEGDPSNLYEAFSGAGWIENARIHDWQDFGGKAIKQKEDNAKRQQEWRDRHKGVTETLPNDPVTVTSPLHNTLDKKRRDKKTEEEIRGEGVQGEPAPLRPLAQAPRPAPKRADARPTIPTVDDLCSQVARWADEKHVAPDVVRAEAEKFVNHCEAGKGGKRVVYANYARALQNWIMNPDYGPLARAPAKTSPNGHAFLHEKDARAASTLERVLARRAANGQP